jgi:hypothetical protein
MAKGTRVSDVQFNVPAGADPMGIGGLDLGRSSYDPLATIRRGWDITREKQERETGRRREDYQTFVKDLPTFEGVNAKVTAELNKDVAGMKKLAEQKMLAGPFAQFAKTEEGKKVEDELTQRSNKIIEKGARYEALKPEFQAAQAFVADPKNAHLINQERTREKMNRFAAAPDLETMEQISREGMEGFVSMIPEPQDILSYVDQVGKGVEGDIEDLEYSIDPASGMLVTKKTSVKDPQAVHSRFVSGYRAATPEMRDAIDEMHSRAPEASKMDEEDNYMPTEDWFANQFSGMFGKTVEKEVKQLRADTDKFKQAFHPGTGRTETGEIIPDAPKQDIVMSMPLNVETKQALKTKKFGKERGVAKWAETADVAESSVDLSFETEELPLSGFADSYTATLKPTSIDQTTGTSPEAGKATLNTPVAVRFQPVWTGPEEWVRFELPAKAGEGQVTEAYKMVPGKPIPKLITDELKRQGRTYEWGAFLVENAIYNPSLEVQQLAPGIEREKYISRHGETLLTGWDEARDPLYGRMNAKEFDTQQVDKYVNDKLASLNKMDRFMVTPSPDKNKEGVLRDLTGR